jgi:hypothetical protein
MKLRDGWGTGIFVDERKVTYKTLRPAVLAGLSVQSQELAARSRSYALPITLASVSPMSAGEPTT